MMNGGNYQNGMFNYGAGMMLLGFILFILFIIGIMLFLIWLTRRSANSSTQNASALTILKTRYAKGEINKDEYEEKKSELS